MIYVPHIDRDLCYYFDNNNTIIELPYNLSTDTLHNVKHISIDNHYNTYYKETYINYTNCLDHNLLSDKFYYRSDIVSILLFFLFMMILVIFIPYKLASRFWKWLK